MFIGWQSSHLKRGKVSNICLCTNSVLILFSTMSIFNYFDSVKPDRKEKVDSHRKHRFVPDVGKQIYLDRTDNFSAILIYMDKCSLKIIRYVCIYQYMKSHFKEVNKIVVFLLIIEALGEMVCTQLFSVVSCYRVI